MKKFNCCMAILIIALFASVAFAQQISLAFSGLQTEEGFVDVDGGKIWYQTIGGTDAIPILIIGGGPGFPHDYLEPMSRLFNEHPVIFYDQLGCGKSTISKDTLLWNIEHFVKEVAQIREALKLDSVHIFAHSWGSIIAVDYMLTKPDGVVGLVLAGPCLNYKRWVEDQQNYLSGMPDSIMQTIKHGDSTGTYNSEQYQAAMMHYYAGHFCRLAEWPNCLTRSVDGLQNDLYGYMWGPSEFMASGKLKDYDRTARLKEISVPTLFTCGQYDQSAPETVKWYQSLLPESEHALFEFSSHMPHLEETDAYLKTVRGFFDRAEEMSKATE